MKQSVSTISLLIFVLIASTQCMKTHERESVGSGITYPIRFAYVNRIDSWSSAGISAGIGVPGYGPKNDYNYFALAFWSCNSALDMALVWANALTYFGAGQLGNTNSEIQASLRQKYNSAGKKILVSAFGGTEMPTLSQDPIACATSLGNFVLNNNLDGADIDYEDNTAMNNGIGQAWLITFTKQLRKMLPVHILTHAPQAPYFCKECYKNGGYATVHAEVGDLIDFYNVQFYNQMQNAYNTSTTLFLSSADKTSVMEIHARGIPLNKIVVGKPVTPTDASNTGWMSSADLNSAFKTAQKNLKWYAGLMIWQFPSDLSGNFVAKVTADLIRKCSSDASICI